MPSLGDLVVTVGAQISGFTDAMKTVNDTLANLQDTASSTLERFDGIIGGFAEVAAAAGIATGAIEIMKEALENFSKAQDVQSSFALLTGSAETASDAFDGLKEMAINLAVPFEDLITVSQRLAPQFGVGTQAMADVLTAAADAARATGNSFDTVAQSLDRIALSGTITTRQMNTLQLSIQDLADQMGVSVTEATDKIKKGGQTAQQDMTAILGAISEQYGGAAEAMATNLSGLFTNLQNQLGFVSEDLGAALAPLADELIAGIKDMEPTLKGIADGAVAAVMGFKDMGAALSSLLPDFVKVIFSGPSMTALGTAVGFVAQTLATLVDTLHAAAIQAGDILAGNFSQLVTDWKAGGQVLTDDLAKFGDIAAKGDELSKTIGDIKIPVFGDTIGNAGITQTTAAIYGLSDAYKDLGVKLPPTEAELNKVANAFEFIQAQYQAGLIPLSQYDAAIDSFTKKMKALEGAFLPANLPADVLGEALKAAGIQNATDQIQKLQEGVAAAGAAFDIGRIPASAYAAEIDKLTAAEQKNSTDGIAGLTTALSIAGEAYATGKIGLDAYAAALDALLANEPAYEDGILKQAAAIAGLNVSIATVTASVPGLDSILKSFGIETADQVTAHIKILQAQLDQANVALGQDLPGAAQAAMDAEHALLIEQQKLASSTLDDATLGIPNLATLQQKLADVNAAYQDLANRGLLNATTALEAQVAQQKAAIDVAVQMGQDVTDMLIDLDATTQALQRQTLGFSDLAKSLQGVELSGLDSAFHDLLFNIGNVSTDFTKLGETMVDVVVNRIIKDALTPLLNVMDKLIAQGVSWIEGILGIGASGAGGVLGTSVGAAGGAAATISSETANTTAVSANTAALAALTSALSSMAGVDLSKGIPSSVPSDGGGGGASDAIGASIAPLAGIITGAISAVTGVIGVFQQMHEQDTLKSIELNTRVTSILLGSANATNTGPQDADSIKGWTKFGATTLGEIKTMLYATIHTDLVGIWNAVQGISLGGVGATLGTALSTALAPIAASVADMESFNWNTLHADLVGIWNGIGDVTNSLVAMPSRLGATLAAMPPPQFKILLDGRELAQSYVVYLSQSGTVAPAV